MKQALSDALAARGYSTLTPVQDAVLAPDLQGRDLLVSAQTGSGKTLGFGLAIAPTLLGEAEAFGPAGAPLALIIAPTRELALQVKRELAWLYEKAGAVLASCVGGMDMRDERRALARGAHIVVATPGRLRDHIMRGSIQMDVLRAVVLDEADEMLDLGFREDLEFILGEAPQDRQTLLFSATVPAAIAKLAESYQRDAERVQVSSGRTQHADIAYQALEVAPQDAENAIINVLRYHEAPNAIVFCNTRAMVARLTTRLSNRGFPVVALSGELTQSERTNALQSMRDGRARICVATDVAARGIDLPNLDLVVHAEVPGSADTLLHRSGRTGRAGRKGTSVLIVPPSVKKKAHRVLGWAKVKAEWGPAPSAEAVRDKDRDRMFADPAWYEDLPESESETIVALTSRFSPEQLAAAYLREVARRRTAPEDLSDPGARSEKRQDFGPARWFALAGGRAAGHDPRRLLPMLCKASGLDRNAIGAIRIRQDESFFQIREDLADGFLAALGPDAIVEKGAKVRPAEAPEPEGKGPRPKKAPHRGKGKPPAPAKSDAPVPRKREDKNTTPPKPKGPKPPKGKPSSKKNRARAAAKKQEQSGKRRAP